MKRWILAGAAALCLSSAQADIVTEFGAGYKIPYTTSVVLLPECHVVRPVGNFSDPSSDHYGRKDASCGGDNPVFIGWPVAWEKDLGVWRIRAGWFHLSSWFDGGPDREVHMDALAITATFNWTEMRRRRRK